MAEPRTRHRGLVAVVVIVVVLVVLVAVAEIGGRAWATGYVRGQLVTALKLPATQRVDVKIAPGSMILQAISGHFDSVKATIPDAAIGGITSDLALAATDVPLDASKPLGTLTVGLGVDAGQVQKLVRGLDGLSAASVSIGDDEVAVASTFSVLGLKVPYGIALEPSASKGDVVLTPTSVSLNGAKVSLADLAKIPLGSNIAGLVKPQHVCVAQYIPKVLTLSRVRAGGNALHLTAVGHDLALETTDFSALGSCN